MTLMELTGQESGIIINPSGSVTITNWRDAEEDSFPFLSPFGVVSVNTGRFDGEIESEHVDDIRTVIPGSVWIDEIQEDADGSKFYVLDTDLDIVCDDNDDLVLLFAPEVKGEAARIYTGDVYRFDDGTIVIAPRGWN